MDDEQDANEMLYLHLKQYLDVIDIVGIAQNTVQAEELIIKYKPSVIFLDIEMPKENAFEFLSRIEQIDFKVVFVTAYDQFAIKALKLNAFDYLLKPVSVDELNSTIQKLVLSFENRNKDIINEIQIKQLANDFEHKNTPKFILLKGQSAIEQIEIDSIYYIEANGSYSIFYYKKNNANQSFIVCHPLLDYEEMLPSKRFYRIHKSFLINTQQINSIQSSAHSLISTSGTKLPISRRRFQDFIEYLKSQ